jgi:NADH:ubiquinone oxidoreductase subunit C
MTATENIKQALVNRFSDLADAIKMPRERRLFLTVNLAKFPAVFDYAVKELKFSHLISITGMDEPQILGFIYHLSQDNGVVLNIRTSVEKNNPLVHTVMQYFPGADIYERELVDLFGAKVEGLAPGNRYPLTDDWPVGQYPLRKDWKADKEKPHA